MGRLKYNFLSKPAAACCELTTTGPIPVNDSLAGSPAVARYQNSEASTACPESGTVIIIIIIIESGTATAHQRRSDIWITKVLASTL